MASTRGPTAQAATQNQIEALLNFMAENEELARGLLRGADGRIRSKNLWESLCNSLNSMGSCTKSVVQWQRVWADRKHLAKKAAGASRTSASATGGGPSTGPTLSQNELRVLSIMGEGFGQPQTDARVPAFPLITNEGSIPLAVEEAAPTPTFATPIDGTVSLEEGSNEAQETPIQQTFNSRRTRRPHTRHLPAHSQRTRIVELEEQRLASDNRRNVVLDRIATTLEELTNLIRQRNAFPY